MGLSPAQSGAHAASMTQTVEGRGGGLRLGSNVISHTNPATLELNHGI